ncbi:MAG: nucleoside 2-deoxyribosyltransferase domain-containing protein [Patescibacteria group bacterium]|jgi:nucleoside 2-deoxyribosyltransferase|nr:nucleoside 2-deoxyribosyltransferase domain-containing protein [Patescibacteria group bacterium]
MKYFISYRHTGADEPRLGNLQKAIKQAFSKRPGDEFYSTYFNQKSLIDENESWPTTVKRVLNFIDTYDVILVVLDSEVKSEGMLIEIGYCLAKNKKIIVAINSQVKNSLCQDLADIKLEYSNLADLKQKLLSI